MLIPFLSFLPCCPKLPLLGRAEVVLEHTSILPYRPICDRGCQLFPNICSPFLWLAFLCSWIWLCIHVLASCKWKCYEVASGNFPNETAGRCPLPFLLHFSSSVCLEWDATILDPESRSPVLRMGSSELAGPASLCGAELVYQPWAASFWIFVSKGNKALV